MRLSIRCWFFLATLLTAGVLLAQSEKEAFLVNAAESACNCYAEKKTPEISMEMAMGTCILGYASENKETYEQLFGLLDFRDSNAMRSLGEQVGLRMLEFCPDVVVQLGAKQSEKNQGQTDDEIKEDVHFSAGQITGVEGKELAVITLRQRDGKPVKFYWLQYFPGSEVLAKKKLLKMEVEIEYRNIDLYSPIKKEYITRREILALRVLE